MTSGLSCALEYWILSVHEPVPHPVVDHLMHSRARREISHNEEEGWDETQRSQDLLVFYRAPRASTSGSPALSYQRRNP